MDSGYLSTAAYWLQFHCSSTCQSLFWSLQPPWWHCTITWLPALVCLPCWLALRVLTACDGALPYLVHMPRSTAARGPRSRIMLHHTELLCTSLLHRTGWQDGGVAASGIAPARESAYNAITVQPRYTQHWALHHTQFLLQPSVLHTLLRWIKSPFHRNLSYF